MHEQKKEQRAEANTANAKQKETELDTHEHSGRNSRESRRNSREKVRKTEQNGNAFEDLHASSKKKKKTLLL